MPDNALDQSEPQQTTPDPLTAPGNAPDTVPATSSSQTSSMPQQPQHKGRRFGFIILLLVIVAVAIAAIAYSVKPSKHQVTSVKRDIPYLTAGISTGGDFPQLYPLETNDNSAVILTDAQLFEGLVRYQDQTKIIPLLATSWSNPDNSTWVFNLRQGVKFHSGRTMTAADVKSSLDYAIAHQNDNASSVLALANTISQVTVTTPYQLKITTNGPDPILLNRLAYLYVFDSKAVLGDPDAGTGPYLVKPGTKPTATTIDLMASNNYWGGHVYTRSVHLVSVTDTNQLVTDTAQGKYDIAGNFDAQQLSKLKRYQTISVPDLGVSFIGLNSMKAGSPLQSLAARQAVAYALDIPAILKAGNLQGKPASQLIPPAIPGYDPSISATPYNPAKAKQLLASVKNAAAPLTLIYPAGDEGQLAEIAKELTAVGFNVKLTKLESFSDLVDQAIGGKTDMFYLEYNSNTLDGLDIINSTIAAPNFSSDELNTLSAKASSTLDPATRIAVLQKIEQLINNNEAAVPLYSLTRTFTLTKPYVNSVDIPSNFTGTYFWQVYQH